MEYFYDCVRTPFVTTILIVGNYKQFTVVVADQVTSLLEFVLDKVAFFYCCCYISEGGSHLSSKRLISASA